MNVPQWLKWMIRQSLGTQRGLLVIALLEGPVGALVDLALKGKPSEFVNQANAFLEEIRNVLGHTSRSVALEKRSG